MRKPRNLACVAAALLVCILAGRAAAEDCSCAGVDPEIERLLREGRAEAALPLAEAAIARDDSRVTQLCRAQVLLSRAAREHTIVGEEALGLEPGGNGTVSVTPEMAAKAFRSEVTLNPHLAAPGIDALERVVERWPSDSAAHRCLLEAHQTMRDHAAFLRVLRRATVDLGPLGPAAIDELLPWTSKYIERDEIESARTSYEVLVAAYPGSAKAQSGLGVAMIKTDRLAEAMQLFDRAHALAPSDTIVLHNVAAAATYQRAFAKARAFYQKALAVSPTSTDIYLELAMLAFADGPTPGIRALETYLARHAENPDDERWAENARLIVAGLKRDASTPALLSLASQLVRMGRSVAAIPLLVGIVAREPARATPRFLLAQAYDVAGFRTIAFDELRKLEPLLKEPTPQGEPSSASVRLELGRLALHLQRNEESVRYLELAVAADPERADGHYTLGLAYERLGRGKPAMAAFEACTRAKRSSDHTKYCWRALEKGEKQPAARPR